MSEHTTSACNDSLAPSGFETSISCNELNTPIELWIGSSSLAKLVAESKSEIFFVLRTICLLPFRLVKIHVQTLLVIYAN